jgi:hypothetical protein
MTVTASIVKDNRTAFIEKHREVILAVENRARFQPPQNDPLRDL